MTLNSKEWVKEDKVKDFDAKEQHRIRSRLYYKNNKHKIIKRVVTNYKSKRAGVAFSLGGKCKMCGEENINFLNFHHTVPMEIKGNKIYHYEANMDILCLLCIKCHTTFHLVMDDLKIDDIYKDVNV